MGIPDHAPLREDEKRDLRNAFGSFATGVTVVTTRQQDGTPRGFTANSFSSVSLDPPLLSICIAKSAHSCDSFTTASHFAVNILGEDQKSVSGLFASRVADRFDRVAWSSGHADMPLIAGSIAHFVCTRHTLVDAGDHVVLIGRVVDFSAGDGQPLGYFRGAYFSVGTDDGLVEMAKDAGNVVIGAILVRNGRLLLKKGPDCGYGLPTEAGTKASLGHLKTTLAKDGLIAHADQLFAVYTDSETGQHHIFYHGSVVGPPPDNMAYFALHDVPIDEVSSPAHRSMLTRYISENQYGSFCIYQGDDVSGRLYHLADEPDTAV